MSQHHDVSLQILTFRCRLHQQACSHRQSWPSQQWTFPSRKSRMPSFPASSSLSSSSFSLPTQSLANISLSKLTMPYFRQDNSATLAAHPTDNQENPIVFLDINVGGAPLGTYSGNRHNQETHRNTFKLKFSQVRNDWLIHSFINIIFAMLGTML